MKNLLGIQLLVLMLSAFLGCQKETEEIIPENSFWVNVDGELWKSDTVYVNFSQVTNITVITANHGNDNEQINLSFHGNSVGAYPFSSGDLPQFGNYFRNSTSEVYWSSSAAHPVGKILVTEYDHANHWLSGNFYFDAYDSLGNKKVLTSGKFNKLILSE